VLRTLDRFLGMEVSQPHTDTSGLRTEQVSMYTAFYNDSGTLCYYPPGVYDGQSRDVRVDGDNVSVMINGKKFSGTNYNTGPITSYWTLQSVSVEPKMSTTHESLANPNVKFLGLTYNLDYTKTRTITLSWSATPPSQQRVKGVTDAGRMIVDTVFNPRDPFRPQ
jgi:hypothetical protein